MLYVADAGGGVVRMSTTAVRVKARTSPRPARALHVAGRDFCHYAVAEGSATLSAVASASGDEACRELLAVHSALYGELDPDAFYPEMIAAGRLIVRLRVIHLYGVMTTAGEAAPAGEGRFTRLTRREDPSGYRRPG